MPASAPQHGDLFVGGHSRELSRLACTLYGGARRAGYKRFVEPAAGAFGLTHLAVQAGFAPTDCDTSDVTIFSALWGAAMARLSLTELQLAVDEARAPELAGRWQEWVARGDYASALWLLLYVRTKAKARSRYMQELLADLWQGRERYTAALQQQLDTAYARIGGLRYRNLDLAVHVAEVLDDPTVLLALNPPTYKAGYEKLFDTDGLLSWAEPSYGLWDPVRDTERLVREVLPAARALVVCYLERPAGHPDTANAVYCLVGSRVAPPELSKAAPAPSANPRLAGTVGPTMLNGYLLCNRPEEARAALGRMAVGRPGHAALEPLRLRSVSTAEGGYGGRHEIPLVGPGFAWEQVTRVEWVPLSTAQATYYATLWSPSPEVAARTVAGADLHAGLVLDGRLAGVWGTTRQVFPTGATPDCMTLAYRLVPPLALSGGRRVPPLLSAVARLAAVAQARLDPILVRQKTRLALRERLLAVDANSVGGAAHEEQGWRLAHQVAAPRALGGGWFCTFVAPLDTERTVLDVYAAWLADPVGGALESGASGAALEAAGPEREGDADDRDSLPAAR